MNTDNTEKAAEDCIAMMLRTHPDLTSEHLHKLSRFLGAFSDRDIAMCILGCTLCPKVEDKDAKPSDLTFLQAFIMSKLSIMYNIDKTSLVGVVNDLSEAVKASRDTTHAAIVQLLEKETDTAKQQ